MGFPWRPLRPWRFIAFDLFVRHGGCRKRDMFTPCTCCRKPHSNPPEDGRVAAYCDRCEVAYLEFKLKLLTAACRVAARRADEV